MKGISKRNKPSATTPKFFTLTIVTIFPLIFPAVIYLPGIGEYIFSLSKDRVSTMALVIPKATDNTKNSIILIISPT
jgi:hypothetical protein